MKIPSSKWYLYAFKESKASWNPCVCMHSVLKKILQSAKHKHSIAFLSLQNPKPNAYLDYQNTTSTDIYSILMCWSR